MPKPQQIACPHCQQALPFDEQRAGNTVNCTYCGKMFKMPSVSDVPTLLPQDPPNDPPFSGQGRTANDWNEEMPKEPFPRGSHSDGDLSREVESSDDARTSRPSLRKNSAAREAESCWTTVIAGLKYLQLAYVIGFMTFIPTLYGLNSISTSSGLGLSSTLHPALDFIVFLSLLAWIVSIVLSLAGKSMCCLSPIKWAPGIMLVSLSLLMASLFLYLIQGFLPRAMPNAAPSRLEVPLFILRVLALVSQCVGEFMLILFTYHLGRLFQDRTVNRISVVSIIALPIFYLISVFAYILLLVSQLEFVRSNRPMRMFEEGGPAVVILMLVWLFLWAAANLIIIVLLQQLRSTVDLALQQHNLPSGTYRSE